MFVRASGKPLTEGVPGFFTVDGLPQGAAAGACRRSTERSRAKAGCSGQRAAARCRQPGRPRALEQDVIALYEADYAKAWDAMLQDLNVVPLRSLTAGGAGSVHPGLAAIADARLLASIARQLTLSEPPPPPGAAARSGGGRPRQQLAAATASAAATEAAGRCWSAPAAPRRAAARPRDRRALQAAARPGRQRPRRADRPGAEAAERPAAATGEDAARRSARAAAGRARPAAIRRWRSEPRRSAQPQPVARWLAAMASSGTALRGGGAAQQVVAAYNGAGGPAALCPLAVNGRYPVRPGATPRHAARRFRQAVRARAA